MNRTPLVRLSAFLAILFLLLPGSLQAQGATPGRPTQLPEPAGPPAPTGRDLQTQAPGPLDLGWDTTVLDVPHLLDALGAHGLALDSQGYPHIVYGSSQLYYASFDGVRWSIETLDGNRGSGNSPSLALDAADRPHIVYVDGSLHYLYYDGTAWQRQVIDRQADYYDTGGADMIMDAAGGLHVSYAVCDNSESDLRYAFYDGVSWITETVEHMGMQGGMYSSLALDSAGRPHISYRSGENDASTNLMYASYDGSAWSIETVEAGAPDVYVGMGTSLALDSADHPHIGYGYYETNGYSNIAKYAYNDGASWSIEIVESGSEVRPHVSLVLGTGDQPRVAYRGNGGCQYAVRSGGTWSGEIVDPNSGCLGSLVLTPSGEPRLAYIGSSLKYAYYDGTSWQLSTVDQDHDTGFAPALVLDVAGRPHVSYCLEQPNRCEVLVYGFYTGLEWRLQRIAGNLGAGGGYPSMVLSGGQPLLAYLDDDAHALRYAYLDGTTWITGTIDQSTTLLSPPSLAVDSTGQPGVAYFYEVDSSHSELRYATYAGLSWSDPLTQSVAGSYWSPSLAIDRENHPHVAYAREYYSWVNYIAYDGREWITGTIDSDSGGAFPSLALDSSDRPHVSYYNNLERTLEYASFDGSSWQIEIVDRTYSFERNQALAIDADDRPHIVYTYDYGTGPIRYAYHDGFSWHIEAIANYRSPELVTMALDADNRPHVLFRDLTLDELLYTYRRESWSPSPWVVEHADRARQFDNVHRRSVAVDSAGHPCIAYSGNLLYYAWYDGQYWQYQVVDWADSMGGYAVLALDADDHPHIVYTGNGQLRYAHYDGSRWIIEPGPISEPWSTEELSLAVDADGHAHVAYPLSYDDDLEYARYEGGVWHVESVPNSAGGRWPALALDPVGRPHIAYSEQSSLGVRYAYYDGSSWQQQLVDGNSTLYTSLALDSADRPHLGYYSEITGMVMYAHLSGTAWIKQSVDVVGSFGGPNSLALDGAGRPHLSYAASTAAQVRYAYYDGNLWQISTVAMIENDHHDNSLALDSTGHAYVSYFNGNGGELDLASWDGQNWTVSVVDRNGAPGRYTSLALDDGGMPHLAYEWMGGVRYAYDDGNSWRLEPVVSELAPGGGYTSLALDANGVPHISYDGGRERGLEYASRDGGAWTSQVVEAATGQQNAGIGSSLVIDADGQPHIAYCFAENVYFCQLHYASYDGVDWLIETVDATLDADGGIRLALDSAGQPHIIYRNQSNGRLHYAYRDETTWITREAPFTAGYGTALALDSLDRPHIVYISHDYNLYHAYLEGSSWISETIVSIDSANGWVSLALDAADHPHIVYRDGALIYAWNDGTSWQGEQVDPEWSVGADSSLWLDPGGRPHIAYYDYEGAKYAYICTPAEGVEVLGPPAVSLGYEQMFTASLVPPGETGAFFAWDNGATGSTAAYSWTVPGVYTLTVTATNSCREVSATLTVAVQCGPLEEASIAGPALLARGETGLYSAGYTPLTATPPITLSWSNGTLSSTAAYSWTEAGSYTVGVAMANGCSIVTAAYRVDVCQPVEGAAIAGPAILLPGENGTFTATVAPPTATLPVTFTWSSGALGPTAAYSWTLPGAYTVTVIAVNACGQATAERGVEVQAAVHTVYLPLVLK